MATIRIGISGWRYEPWRGFSIPPICRSTASWNFARAFPTIEINGSFYSLQTPASYAAWYAATPADFVFSVKGPRYITHILRLKDVHKPLANFFASGVFNLREKLGPMLWQFPPSLAMTPTLRGIPALLPRDTQQALASRAAATRACTAAPLAHRRAAQDAPCGRDPPREFRERGFVEQLRRHRIALVVADTAGKWPYLEDVTADFMYLRLHGDKQLYASGYTEAALDRWAERIRAWQRGREPRDAAAREWRRSAAQTRDVYCYFDNDVKVRAPFDADRLMQKLGLKRSDATFVFPNRRVLRNIRPVAPLPPFRWRRPRAPSVRKPARG